MLLLAPLPAAWGPGGADDSAAGGLEPCPFGAPDVSCPPPANDEDPDAGGPSAKPGGGSAAGRRRRRVARRHDEVQVTGPCFCKILVPNHVAGAIIGRQGSTIAYIELLTRCQMQISAGHRFFPGTNDRIVIMGGTMQGLQECIVLVLRRLRDFSGQTERPLMMKLVVPNSAVSALIGRGGHVARRLSSSTDCRVNISPRVGELKERLVMLSGDYANVAKAALQVCREVQADPHLAEHLCLKYDVRIPLGAWAGAKAAPVDPTAPLLSPASITGRTKRELIEYLRKAAPREILMRHGLLGNINNTVKCKGYHELASAVAETWLVRGGYQSESPHVDSAEDDTPFSDGDSVSSWSVAPHEVILTLRDMDLIKSMNSASCIMPQIAVPLLPGCRDSDSTRSAGSGASCGYLLESEAELEVELENKPLSPCAPALCPRAPGLELQPSPVRRFPEARESSSGKGRLPRAEAKAVRESADMGRDVAGTASSALRPLPLVAGLVELGSESLELASYLRDSLAAWLRAP